MFVAAAAAEARSTSSLTVTATRSFMARTPAVRVSSHGYLATSCAAPVSMERPRLALAFKAVNVKHTLASESWREAAVAYLTAAYVVAMHTEQPSVWARLRAMALGEGAPMHVEFLLTMPCTMADGVPCHVPVSHPNGRASPNHCIAITCAKGSVHMKESPSHAEPLWTYYPVRATDEEIYRLFVFSVCMLGSQYRFFDRRTYFIEPVPEACATRIVSAYARTAHTLEYLDAAREFDEEVQRGHAMREARKAFDRANPNATPDECERFVTAEAFRQLMVVLPRQFGNAQTPAEVARLMTARVHQRLADDERMVRQGRRAAQRIDESQFYTNLFRDQPFKFTCVQFACDALAFAGILQRFRQTHADGRRLYPANCLVGPLHPALRAEGDPADERTDRVGRSSEHCYALMVDASPYLSRGYVPPQPPQTGPGVWDRSATSV